MPGLAAVHRPRSARAAMNGASQEVDRSGFDPRYVSQMNLQCTR